MLTRESPITAHDQTARTVTVQLCRWNDPRDVVDPDGSRYREQFPPGSLELAADIHAAAVHHGAVVGRADPATYRETDTGPTIDVIVSHSAAGRDVMADIDAGVVRSVSMEIEPVTQRTVAGVVTRTRSIVHGLAFAFRPAHDAPILTIRERQPNMTPMSDTPTLDAPETDAPPVHGDVITPEVLTRELDLIRREMLTSSDRDTGSPLMRYRSLGEITEAGFETRTRAGTDPALLHSDRLDPASPNMLLMRALADQITGNNPGVMPPSWVSTVFGIIDRGRPTVNAFGVDSPGSAGLEVNWPYFDGDLTALVGEQLVQKTPITSVRVDLKKGSEDLRTFAGGSDIAYQLIRRSSPSYRDTYMRIMMAAYAAVTNAAAGTSIVAGQGIVYDIATDTTGSKLRSALFQASVLIEAATGSPAGFALAATDVFVKIGGMTQVMQPEYGTNNIPGTASAASLRVSVAGLPVIHDPYLTAGDLFVSNDQAASWYEDGPFTVTAEDVEKLGQNVAVWGLGAFGIHLPAGIVQLNATGTPAAAGATSSARKAK